MASFGCFVFHFSSIPPGFNGQTNLYLAKDRLYHKEYPLHAGSATNGPSDHGIVPPANRVLVVRVNRDIANYQDISIIHHDLL
jgi:hypothetical protein